MRFDNATLDRTANELQHAVGPFQRSPLHRLGLAVLATGVIDIDDAEKAEDAAHELMWDTLSAGYEHAPAREIFKRAGLDVRAIEEQLTVIEKRWYEAELERERQLYKREDELDAANRRERAWRTAA